MPYKDLPEVAEIFADKFCLIHFNGQVFHIELAVSRPTPTDQPGEFSITHYPAVRLVLTATCAAQLRDSISNLLAQLAESGVIKRIASSPETKQ